MQFIILVLKKSRIIVQYNLILFDDRGNLNFYCHTFRKYKILYALRLEKYTLKNILFTFKFRTFNYILILVSILINISYYYYIERQIIFIIKFKI